MLQDAKHLVTLLTINFMRKKQKTGFAQYDNFDSPSAKLSRPLSPSPKSSDFTDLQNTLRLDKLCQKVGGGIVKVALLGLL